MTTDSNTPLPNSPAASPLSAEQLMQIQEADARRKKMGRAIRIADADAKLTTFFAIVAVASAPLFRDWSALVIGLALGVVAYNSLRGRRLMRNMDPAAARLLALNQLLLAFFLTVYFVWSMFHYTHMSDTELFGASAQDIRTIQDGLGLTPAMIRQLIVLVFGLCIAGTLIAQGLMGLYYFTRRKRIDAYLNETPPWILELQRAQQK